MILENCPFYITSSVVIRHHSEDKQKALTSYKKTSLQVPANHLLSASVMSAPAALAIAKLFWPETEEIRARSEDVYQMEKG